MDIPEWKEFEIAVTKFVQALDPKATITHNARLPDVHTHIPRQRDVLIEGKVCQHFPIKGLLSCKRKKRKLDQQDIDAFIGEMNSSGANLGVIYSYSGFTKNAIIKARNLQISCCRLYRDERPDIPDSIVVLNSYCCTPRISLSVIVPLDPSWNLKIWNDLFSLPFEDGGAGNSVLDIIVETYFEGETESKQNICRESVFPSGWTKPLELFKDLQQRTPIKILVRGLWNIYEGKLEACLLDGSYNFTSDEFVGSQSGPTIDLHSPHPGPGWRLLNTVPSLISAKRRGKNICICVLYHGNAKEVLLQNLGPKPIRIENIDLRQ